jgi:hypothetical protein
MKRRDKITASGEKILNRITLISDYGMQLSIALLFATAFIYLSRYGNGIFFYQENRSLFIYSGEFLRKFIVKPGGLLTYAGIFLTQGYFSPLYGSLLISILVLSICLIFKAIIKRMGVTGAFSLFIILLPSVLLLLSQTQIEFPLQLSLGFFITALWFLVSISSEGKSSPFIIMLLFPLFFYVAGSFALIYLGMYITFSLFYNNGRQKYSGPLLLLGYAILNIIVFSEIIFFQPLRTLLGYPLILNESTKLTIYPAILGVLLIMYPLITKFSVFSRIERYKEWITAATIILLFPLLVFLLAKHHDPVITNVLKIEKYFYDRDWDSVISQYEKKPAENVVGQYYYNLALSEKGELCNRMFSGLQSSGPLSLSLEGSREQTFRTIYFYYTIGLINQAHHLAYELMVQHGYTPENIKMLIKTELINGNYRIAERYINILKKTLYYRKDAGKYEKMLNNPQLVNTDPELGNKIRLIPREDFFITTNDSRNIDLLLKANPGNKKAFEYKIARFLLEKDIIAVVNEVSKMKDFGYTTIPKHIEEAVVAYINFSKESPDLGGLRINQETERRFIGYGSILNTYRGDKSQIGKAMKKSEKNTFWYYLQFSTIKSDFWKSSSPADRNIY